jgi:hypothetical protein
MRTLFTLLIAIFAITIGNGQSGNAVKDQQAANKALEEMKAKGMIPTTEGGWTLTATVDGKPWKAQALYSPNDAGRIVGFDRDGKISLPYPGASLEVGYKSTFGEDNAVDFSPIGASDFWSAHTGQMEITKVSGGWIEGKFFFTAALRGTNKKSEVTNGFFRISTKNR